MKTRHFRFFCGKDELKPVNIFEKSGKKTEQILKSHSFSPIGMLLAGVLQRKRLAEVKNTGRNPCYVRL